MTKDTLFRRNDYPIADFAFTKEVVEVFDDMLNRSVPQYRAVQDLVVQLAKHHYILGTKIVDVGCSLGSLCRKMATCIPQCPTIVGIDASDDMIAEAKRLTTAHEAGCRLDLRKIDAETYPEYAGSSVVTMLLTLQFIRPPEREKMVRTIYNGLVPGGALIMYEKTVHPQPIFNRNFIELYHDFKKGNGYAETEILAKRIALENVLIPYSIEENVSLLEGVGFRSVATFCQWLNFAGIIALK